MTTFREISVELHKKAPGAAVEAALEELLTKDRHLLEVDANERSLTYRFGMYLQQRLQDFDVDCEYNRNGQVPKTVPANLIRPMADDTDAKTVFPDVIAHKRGGNSNNYLVIEFKKSTNNTNHSVDLDKLRAYKSELNYTFALFIVLATGSNPGVEQVQWI